MLYFKNTELAEKYHISEGTVRNWIKSAQQEKLLLVLHTENGRPYVANTASNIAIIEKLVEKRRKYRNTKAAKLIKPLPEFYRLYNESQVYDIMMNIEMHHEIPRQYSYFDGGAAEWDKYTCRMAAEDTPNMTNGTIRLLARNQVYINDLLSKYKTVNVVDVGVGNALPAKDLLTHFIEKGVLGRYIALDTSPDMLKIAERNIKEWFKGVVRFEGYELDINNERFPNVLAEAYIQEGSEDVANLLLLLGGTPSNLRKPDNALGNVHDSMGPKDFLIFTYKLDTDRSRRFFDFNIDPGQQNDLPPIHGLVVNLLNIDKSYYEMLLGYDPETKQRYERIRFKVTVTIEFEFSIGRRLVTLNKGDSILIWRAWQRTPQNLANQFSRNGFYTLHSNQTEDEEYILTISRVKRD